jgi:hypothetical protein
MRIRGAGYPSASDWIRISGEAGRMSNTFLDALCDR